MKNNVRLLVTIVLLSCFTLIGYAQLNQYPGSASELGLTPEQEAALQGRAKEKVALMNKYISYMVDNEKTVETRLRYKQSALNLFIGYGYSYEEDGEEKEGVFMEITSLSKTTTKVVLMRNYFSSLIGLTENKYDEVDIQSTKIPNIKVSRLKQIDSDTYECTCQYDQYFIAYRDRMVVYKDKTTKRIKCIIKVEETEDDKEFIVLLGDVIALETKRL